MTRPLRFICRRPGVPRSQKRRLRAFLAMALLAGLLDPGWLRGAAPSANVKTAAEASKPKVSPENEIVPDNLPPLDTTPSEHALPDEEIVGMSKSLSLESRRYLLYLYARMNRPQVAEALAERILRENPGDQRTLLVLASMHLERKSAEKALEIAKSLTAIYPDDDQSRYFLGAAYFLSQQYDAANEVFRDLKVRQFKGRLYPYEADLAASALKAGDWFRAKLAYEELLRKHKLRPPLRFEARQALESIYRAHLPQLRAYNTSALLKSGTLHRPGVDYRQHLEDRQSLSFSLQQTRVNLEEAPSVRKYTTSHWQGQLGLESIWRRHWRTSAWLGGAGDLPFGGVRLTRDFGEVNDIWIEASGHERVSDGLLIEALDGRQHQLTFGFTHALRRNFTASAQFSAREASIESTPIGNGLTFQSNLDYVLKRGWPEWHAGMRSYWSTFHRNDAGVNTVSRIAPEQATQGQKLALMEQLILPGLHREGVYLNARHQLSGVLYLRASCGVDYSFDRAAFEYYGQGGFSVFPRKRLELEFGAAYSSSARSADQNSDQWLLDFGLKYWF